MNEVQADSHLIYFWTNPRNFIFNTGKHPFLQNIIAHAWTERTLHVVIYHPNLNQFDKQLIDLKCKLQEQKINNICFYKLQEVFANQPAYIERVFKLFARCQSLANPIDFIKIIVGANLVNFGLKQGLLVDMDCIVPKEIELHVGSLSVYPAVDPHLEFEQCGIDAFNSYIENSFSFVLGEKNKIFSKILTEIMKMELTYFYQRETDGVYLIYLKILMQYFTNEDKDNNYLSQKYKNFHCLPPSITKALATSLTKIQTYRGGGWYQEESITLEKEIPLVFVRGYQPVYPKELDDLISAIFNKKFSSVQIRLDHLIKKEWNPNQKIIFNTLLEKKENILYFFILRNLKIKGKNIKTAAKIIEFILDNGLKKDEKLLSFFMQLSKPRLHRDCFYEYARVFADNYQLDYKQMLIDIDTEQVPSFQQHSIEHNWMYCPKQAVNKKAPALCIKNSFFKPFSSVPSHPDAHPIGSMCTWKS